MQGKKTNSKLISDIVTNKLTNPDLSTRDIAEDVEISHSTVADILNKEAGNLLTTSDNTKKLFEINVWMLNEWKIKLKEWIKTLSLSSYSDMSHLSNILDTSFKQNRLIEDKSTENIEINWADILKDIQTGKITKNEAYEIMKQIKE